MRSLAKVVGLSGTDTISVARHKTSWILMTEPPLSGEAPKYFHSH